MKGEPRTEQHLGFQGVADALSTESRPISRQQVYVWWTRRARNGFPDRHTIDGHDVFLRSEILAWWGQYVPNRGGRPRKEG